MKATRTSKTAEQMALSRAIDTRRPAGERICDDPFAARFLPRRYAALLVVRPVRDAISSVIEALFPGHHHYVLVRTRYFDEVLTTELDHGAEQVVILGAGFDSRAYRFADRLRGAIVFEVDHPATSRAKQRALERVLDRRPDRVRYVAVDFNRHDLAAELAASGYQHERRTVFLWEGTTPYLAPEAVDATLGFIARGSAPGSVVVFDYILRSVLDGTCDMRGARSEDAKMKTSDEPFTFGIADGEAEAFLDARGFHRVTDVGADALRDRFVPASRRDAYVKPWWRIVRASVL